MHVYIHAARKKDIDAQRSRRSEGERETETESDRVYRLLKSLRFLGWRFRSGVFMVVLCISLVPE